VSEHVCAITTITARAVRGGSIQYVRQCIECGYPVGSAIARAVALAAYGAGAIPVFDEGLRVKWNEAREVAAQDRREAEHAQWLNEHSDYLQSHEWKSKRRLVLERDGGKCQGCLDARATVVHHLTYKRWRCELMLDLVSLCEPCHAVIHAEDEDAA
jgi:5-methylcytosine-specific restriction endonuclease McrA